MEMRLLEGRDFDERDSMATPRVAVISASLAERLWTGRSPLGRFVAARNNFPAAGEKVEWLEVVGLVNEVDPILRDMGTIPFIYVPLGQQWLMSAGTLVARVQGDGRDAVTHLKQAVTASDSSAEVYRIQSMEQMVGEILYPRRMAAGILSIAGLIGLVLASVGLYGLVSYILAQRQHEMGVRTALGASRSDLIRMVLGEGLRLAFIGGAIGAPLTYAALRLSARITGAAPGADARTSIVVSSLLLSVILLACYIPARRAARVDPMIALRSL